MTMYSDIDFKSKKALKEAVASGVKVRYYQPGPFGGNKKQNGEITLEGPIIQSLIPGMHGQRSRMALL